MSLTLESCSGKVKIESYLMASLMRPKGSVGCLSSGAMTRGRYRLLVVVLAAFHLGTYTAGEALHLLPGMGHFEEMPSGICVWNGAPRQDRALCCPVEPSDGWRSQEDQPGEVLGLDECPICHLTSLTFNRVLTTCSVIILPTCGQFYLTAAPSAPSFNVAAYGARAPPC